MVCVSPAIYKTSMHIEPNVAVCRDYQKQMKNIKVKFIVFHVNSSYFDIQEIQSIGLVNNYHFAINN